MIVKSFLTWIQALAASLGAPGLFLVAALDSSFLSLPQVNDLLLILSVTRHPEWMPLYASMSTLGSLAGCFVMYGIGRKGEEALIRKRFSGPRSQRALALFNRFGMLAVLVPAILPPPAPFKIFVILAGASRMNPWTFAIAVVLGRGFRYFGEGLLTVWYGERALAFLQENGRQVALWTGLTVLGARRRVFLVAIAAPARRRRTAAAGLTRTRATAPTMAQRELAMSRLRHVVDALAGRDLGLDVGRRPAQLERHDRGGALERRASRMPGHAGLGAAQDRVGQRHGRLLAHRVDDLGAQRRAGRRQRLAERPVGDEPAHRVVLGAVEARQALAGVAVDPVVAPPRVGRGRP